MGDCNRAVASWSERRIVRMIVAMAVWQRRPWVCMEVFVLFSHTFSLQSRQQRAGESQDEHQDQNPNDLDRKARVGNRQRANRERARRPA